MEIDVKEITDTAIMYMEWYPHDSHMCIAMALQALYWDEFIGEMHEEMRQVYITINNLK